MNCKEFLQCLDAYLDGELAQPEREAFLRHAQNCSACADALAHAEAVHAALSHLNDDLCVPLPAQAAWRAAVKREAKRRKGRVLTRALSAFAAAFVVLAGTTAVFRATGVLDFDVDNAPAASVHIEPSAPRAEYYDEITAAVDEIQPATANGAVDPAQARHALVEADGAVADGGAGAQTAAPESEDSAAGVNALIAGDESSAETTQESEEAAGKERLLARSATREMRTENFDATHTSIQNLVEEYGGNVVNDAVSGQNGARSAVMAVDVPADELDAFLEALDFVAEVTYRSVSSEDISANYYDAQGRLETLRLEKDRLNQLIAEASDAAALAELDAQLDEVYAQIDTLEGKLRGFDNQLAHARVDIALTEGAHLEATAITGDGDGAAQQGLTRSLEAIGAFFSDMGVSLAVIAPYAGIAVLLIALVWVGVFLYNRRRRD